ncbi:acyltransferase [Curtobacterium flaccumfaciens pv. beticola]|uniref:Acyltransferase n=1 Tax=Curtobacterium citreum TaxID=2036 RepID=A0A850DWP3_9MICO|nr:acyltransferase family protein [Curtobacterium albidum]MCS5486846.1 acyltransferase [Curtobacterium flaccumfaciens pv. basellae]NUU27972.1 acyltransferase [Curtobacterium albidum]
MSTAIGAGTAPAPTAAPPAAHRRRDTTRWDVQGLRAFAVLAVVVYHLWPRALPGGFVGVDVFFVISGYLITGHLLREQVATGRIALARFWARRAKRLLPGAFLTIAATGAAVLAVVPSALWSQYGRELIASTVYVQNWELAASAVDYLDAENKPSPFQHFWSLSVEEQFYIALPVLLILLTAALRRRLAPATTARLLLGSVAVLSFAWSLHQTATSPDVAYFSTATRAWEFALGGLAATLTLPRARTTRARAVRLATATVGAVALVVSLAVIHPSTPFPGVAAVLPVVGATLLVTFGASTVFESIGALRPVAFTGRVSYALYLWHWPFVVIVPIVLGHAMNDLTKAAVLVVAYGIAAVTTVFVEEPLRFSRWVAALRPRRVAVLGVVGSLVVVALGASTLAAVHVQEQQAAASTQHVRSGAVRCFGAAAAIGTAKPCTDPALADIRVPAPAAAAKDDPNKLACWNTVFRVCALGKTTGYTKRFVALGDSHNNALIGAYDELGREQGWRIDLSGSGGCYLTTARQDAPDDATTNACTEWKHQAIAYVQEHRSELAGVLVTHSSSLRQVEPPAGESQADATVQGMVDAWQQAAGDRLPVIAIRDNPVAREDVILCVSRMSGATDDSCDRPRADALTPTDHSAEAVAAFRAAGGRATLVDFTDLYCTEDVCPPVIGGVLVYRDSSHVTRTWAATLVPYLARAVESTVAAR